ncbi:MAG: hypothetical protein MK081_08505 [Flavobacteriales bacterium]|nr:hypothetical protein [Flavobacteriales bacterium]
MEIELAIVPTGRFHTYRDNEFGIRFTDSDSINLNQTMIKVQQDIDALFASSSLDLAKFFGRGSSAYKRANREELEMTNMVTEEDSVSRKSSLDSLAIRFEALELEWSNKPLNDYSRRAVHSVFGQVALTLGDDPVYVQEEYLPENINLNNPEEVLLLEQLTEMLLLHNDAARAASNRTMVLGEVEQLIEVFANTFTDGDQVLAQLMTLATVKRLWFEDVEARYGCTIVLNTLAELEVGEIATSMKGELTRGTRRAEQFLPDVTLVDHKGDRVELSSFSGEFVYLSVVQTGSLTCQRELMVMERLERTYGRSIHFVTLVMDETSKELTNYLASARDQEWTFLLGGGNPKLKHELRLRTIPTFYLIGPDGRLINDYTKSPSEGIEDLFRRL